MCLVRGNECPAHAYHSPAIASFSLGTKRDFLMKHKPIPLIPCGHGKQVPFPLDRPCHGHVQHKPVETRVMHKQVAATTEDEDSQPSLLRKAKTLQKVAFAPDLGKEAGRTADAEGSAFSQGDVFENLHPTLW